jgi:hypothetical protein
VQLFEGFVAFERVPADAQGFVAVGPHTLGVLDGERHSLRQLVGAPAVLEP